MRSFKSNENIHKKEAVYTIFWKANTWNHKNTEISSVIFEWNYSENESKYRVNQ